MIVIERLFDAPRRLVFEAWTNPERLAYTIAIADSAGNKVDPAQVGHDPQWPRETRVIVTFDDCDGKTKLTLRQDVPEALAKKTGAYPSWLQMLDRLDDLMSSKEVSHV